MRSSILIFETDTYGSINSKNSGMQAGLGGILYSQLPHADWYIPRARASMAEVAKAELVNRWFYTTQSQLQDIFRNDWTFAGKYSKRREACIAYMESTVVDIFITPPSFKPVSFSLSRSPLF